MSDQYITRETDGRVALITVNRPAALNALNQQVLLQLEEALRCSARENDRVIILTGAGNRAFVAGADIAAMADMTPAQSKAFSNLGQRIFSSISKMEQIVIAAVNGFALGGGCELAMACDFRVASKSASFGIPEVSLGVIPAFGGTQRLPRLVGRGAALEMLCTGARIDSGEALRMGLVNHVTEPEALIPFCRNLAEKICFNSGQAVAAGKSSIYEGLEMPLSGAMEYEATLFAVTFTAEDQREGMNAFLEKRKAAFKW